MLPALAATVVLAACGGGGGGDAGMSITGSSQTSSASPSSPSGSATSASPGESASAPQAASSPAPASGTTATSAEMPVIAPSGSFFYGMNGHVTWVGPYTVSSPQQQLAQLKDLDVKLYRNDVGSVADAVKLKEIAQMMARSGVTVYPVILQQLNFADENAAYQASYTLAQQIVNVQRYAWYEVTNELAPSCLVGWVDGVRSTDYRNDCFQIARGVIRGLIAGIKSVDSQGKIIIGGNTWMHYGFDVMLANGTQPDGTSGHPVVTWDITAWHWYSEQGDIRNACGGTGCYNVIGTLQSFGKPIWINEVGMRPYFPGTPDQAATYMANNMMGALLAIAPQYNIQSLQVYELYDDPPTGQGPYGIMLNDGQTKKPVYTAVRNFVATNPR
ncbi:hypothetical protein AWB78_05805 [Caballeronia calidae]|uniref:Asl1-like glycosyl hydrolase catalytic domain-containing protein n=2 Tax=Caballeronia calidae TaxID=1777139 RepID=A0A158DZD7_9BURK|nr:hypothetical protein AWB78_05805 [Caballeronia calidae]